MDIVQHLFTLPAYIEVKGYSYKLELFINHPDYDFRLCYKLDEPVPMGWISPDGSTRRFVCLEENISNDSELHEAIDRTQQYLIAQGIDLIKPEE